MAELSWSRSMGVGNWTRQTERSERGRDGPEEQVGFEAARVKMGSIKTVSFGDSEDPILQRAQASGDSCVAEASVRLRNPADCSADKSASTASGTTLRDQGDCRTHRSGDRPGCKDDSERSRTCPRMRRITEAWRCDQGEGRVTRQRSEAGSESRSAFRRSRKG